MLPIKRLTMDQTTLWAKANNDCNKSTFKSGENHVWIRWYSPLKYFKMGLAKDGGPGGGGKSEVILNANNVDNPEFIQIVGPDYEPKIQIKYKRAGKICTVTLEPCDETKRTTQYKDCLTPVYAFTTQKEWVDQVMDWFKYKKLISTKTKTTTPVTDAKVDVDVEVERIIKEEEQKEKQKQLNDQSKRVENTQLSALTQQINEWSSQTDKEVNKQLAEAQQQLDEHNNLMEPPKNIGGKKSRKNRRTKRRKSNRRIKRRKSNRRKKAKKTKKH